MDGEAHEEVVDAFHGIGFDELGLDRPQFLCESCNHESSINFEDVALLLDLEDLIK